jgi:hypothetical protein
MFFGFTILATLEPSALLIFGSIISAACWIFLVVDDWNYQDDYEEDN